MSKVSGVDKVIASLKADIAQKENEIAAMKHAVNKLEMSKPFVKPRAPKPEAV